MWVRSALCAPRATCPDENNNKRAQTTMVERDSKNVAYFLHTPPAVLTNQSTSSKLPGLCSLQSGSVRWKGPVRLVLHGVVGTVWNTWHMSGHFMRADTKSLPHCQNKGHPGSRLPKPGSATWTKVELSYAGCSMISDTDSPSRFLVQQTGWLQTKRNQEVRLVFNFAMQAFW